MFEYHSCPSLRIEDWIQMFPIGEIRRAHAMDSRRNGPDGEMITSPYDLAVVEQLRQEVVAERFGLLSVPTDVFVFALGEPVAPYCTKIGGIPYRDSSKPWPVSNDGRPYVFIAQFYFGNSHDVVGATPDEILLVFANDRTVPNDVSDAVIFEWSSLNIQMPMTRRQMPLPDWVFVNCHGIRHRTVDYVDADDLFEASVERCPYFLGRLCGTKIGGAPCWMQQPAPEAIGRKFLCSIGSVQFAPNLPFPWTNHPEPLSLAELHESKYKLMWGDMGSMYIFISDDGTLWRTVQY